MRILSGKEIIERKIVEGIIGEKQIQPAGIDLTVKEIYKIVGSGRVDFDNTERKIAEREKVEFNQEGWTHLAPGVYMVILNEIVNIPKNCLAFAKPRSSITRNGCTVETAFWDPGYVGRSEVLLIVYNPKGISIKKNARILQLAFLENPGELGEYNGIYKGENL